MPENVWRLSRLKAEFNVNRVTLGSSDTPINQLEALLIVRLNNVNDFCGGHGEAANGTELLDELVEINPACTIERYINRGRVMPQYIRQPLA